MPDLVLRYEARVNALRASSFHYIDEGVLQEYTLGKLERNYIRDRNVVSQISSLVGDTDEVISCRFVCAFK